VTISSDVKALLDQSNWQQERRKLRALLLSGELSESVKWGKLCYSFDGAKVAIFYGMKDYCALGFFKGALLADADHKLVAPGKNSQAMRQLRFRTMADIEAQEASVRSFID
jgi:uncharacterized protein YdeI (YjbR/CyaY-like superfamily)